MSQAQTKAAAGLGAARGAGPVGAQDAAVQTLGAATRYASPWTLKVRVLGALWHLVWLTLFRPTPKHLNPWRVLLLRVFGAKITGHVYVAPSARVKFPFHLEMHEGACLAYDSEVYNLGYCVLGKHAIVTQGAYLCGGTHDLSVEDQPLVVGKIELRAETFVGARAMILPGVTVGEGAVVGAGAVVSRDVPPWVIVAGNPAREVKKRLHPRSVYGTREKTDADHGNTEEGNGGKSR